jgi:predicted amidohydrolase
MKKAAVVQLCSTMDVDANFKAIERFTREAASSGADIVALPENAAFLRTDSAASVPIQPMDGTIISRFRSLASQCGVWLLVGSHAEESPTPTHYYQTSVVIDGTQADAPITATYRKLHLFDIDIKGGEVQRESDEIAPGQDMVCTSIAGIQTGLSICYDLRFPKLYQGLVDRGAQMLSVPSAFTEFTGKEHWLALLRARAIENQTFVLAPNQYGFHGGKRRSFGKSVIYDPWGIALCVASDRPGWAMAPIDLDYLAQVRASLPCHQHRHPNVR